MNRRLLTISAGLAALYLVTLTLSGFSVVFRYGPTTIDVFVVLKVGSILALLLIACRAQLRLLAAALGCSAIGDFLLGVQRIGPLDGPKLFMGGLAAFLVAHLWYISLFWRNRLQARLPQWRRFAIVLVVATLWFTISRLWPTLGGMRFPVVLYTLALSTMAITAQLARFSDVVALGALSFVASDAMLAVSHFHQPFPGSHPLVWLTYYAAQALITVGVAGANRSNDPSMLPAATQRL